MPSVSSTPNRTSAASFEPALKLFGLALSAYLGAIYIFSFKQTDLDSRKALLLAVLILNALLVVELFREGPGLLLKGFLKSPDPLGLRRLLSGIACGLLVVLAGLYVDFGLARIRGGEFGMMGNFEQIKFYILCSLYVWNFSWHWLKWLLTTTKMFPPLQLTAADLLLFTLPLIPLVNYLTHNRADFIFLTAVQYLAFFLLWPLAAFVVFQMFQQWFRAEAIAAPLVAGFAFVFYSRPLMSALFKRPIESLLLAEIVFGVLISTLLAFAYRATKKTTVQSVVAVVICSVVGSFIQTSYVGNPENPSTSITESKGSDISDDSELTELLSAPAKKHPDVYLLIYDGYASPVMLKRYGLESASASPYLRSQGFTVYDHTYSLFLMSKASMSSVLDMTATPRAGIGGNTRSNEFFQRHGYSTYLVLNSYLLGGSGHIMANSVYPSWSYRSALSTLYRGIGGGEFKSEIVFSDTSREKWLAAKRSVFTQDSSPKMLYAHSGYPSHSQNSGTCLADETERYGKRLRIANDEMRQDIETILQSRRDSIIIVAGDHGPHLTGDCLYMSRQKPDDLSALHLADRYGTFLAIRWPEHGANTHENITVLQNVFFAISAYLLDDPRVWSHRLQSATVGFGGIPTGAVQKGIVMIGKNKGHSLFEP